MVADEQQQAGRVRMSGRAAHEVIGEGQKGRRSMGAIEHERTWITARLEGDTLRVTLHGQAAYGEDKRTVTASIDLTDDTDSIGAALAAVVSRHADAIERATYDAAVEAYAVMRRRG
jgi:hypothetical protein